MVWIIQGSFGTRISTNSWIEKVLSGPAGITVSLYVDDILASADADKKHQLDLFVRKIQKQFSVRLLGEPTKFLGMEITYMREQGICCISQQTYIDKLVSTFLSDHDSTSVFFPTTLWRHVYTTS